MALYDTSGTEVFWGWDDATSVSPSSVMPGPRSVFHAFDAEANRRRLTARCGASMLTYSVPGNIDDLRSDSVRVPICRACSDDVGTTPAFRLVKARFARRATR